MKTRRKPSLRQIEARLCLAPGRSRRRSPARRSPCPAGPGRRRRSYGSPIFADLKGDGHQELIVEAAGGKMIAYGTERRGPARQVPGVRHRARCPNGVHGELQVDAGRRQRAGHRHGDRRRPSGATRRTPGTVEDGRVYAFNAVTGQVLPGWPQNTSLPPPDQLGRSGVTGPLTVGYLEGNGMPDVIVDSFSTLVTAFRSCDGTKLWQFENDETVEPGAVVADLYGDGKQEVIYTSGISGRPSQYYPAGGLITILNQDGSLLRRIHIGESIFAVADRRRPLRRRPQGDHRRAGAVLRRPRRPTPPPSRPPPAPRATASTPSSPTARPSPAGPTTRPATTPRTARPGRSPSRPTSSATARPRSWSIDRAGCST